MGSSTLARVHRRDRHWRFLVTGFYADDVKPPKTPRGEACSVLCATEVARDFEIEVFERRQDIGRIVAVELER